MKNLVITQRADDFSYGLPYCVTDMRESTKTESTIFSHPEELSNFTDKEKYIITNEFNAFGNVKIICLDKTYTAVKFFKTLKQAEKHVRNN